MSALLAEKEPDYAPEYHADLPVGEILRRARVYYGRSLQDVERVLRIRASQLAALENGQIESLPGRVYAIGFVRAYAEYLDLDGDKVVHLFKAQDAGGVRKPELAFPVPASESKLPSLWILLGSIAGLIVVLALISFFQPKPSPDLNTIPPAPSVQEVSSDTAGVSSPATSEMHGPPVPSEVSSGAQAESPLPEAPAEKRITIQVTEPAWVSVQNAEGKVVLSRVLNSGERYAVPTDKVLTLETGNIGGLTFTVNGETLPPLGESGDIRRNLVLTAEGLGALDIETEE